MNSTAKTLAAHAALLALAAMLSLAGCREDSSEERPRGPAASGERKDGLFESVAQNLDHLEQFDTEQILKQICDRLNQWTVQEKPQVAWQRDPLVDTLDEKLRTSAAAGELARVAFQDPDDAWFLQEAVWLRDISGAARGEAFDDLAVAQRLFDWTVRNIQLEADRQTSDPSVLRHQPFETLLMGRGTAAERAWVFLLLARQQGLDVVMLGLADEDGTSVREWLPALVAGDDLYLFDCRLGLPIPGHEPDSVATLADVAADEKLLRDLDLDAEHPYPVRAEDLKHVVAFVEGSPAALSRRMALVESRLTGKRKMKLTSPGSALAQRVKQLPHVADARLWSVPFEVALARAGRTPEQSRLALRELVWFYALPTLKRGRALHFKGQYEGLEGAKSAYLNARPPDQYFQDFKLPPEMVQRIPPESLAKVEAAQILMMREGKQHASFWIGLIFFEQRDYSNAIDFLAKRTLGTDVKSPWASSARYNLARTYEATGEPDKAIELYESDTTSPQRHGNLLRARRLKAEHEAKQAAPAN